MVVFRLRSLIPDMLKRSWLELQTIQCMKQHSHSIIRGKNVTLLNQLIQNVVYFAKLIKMRKKGQFNYGVEIFEQIMMEKYK